MGKAFSDIVAGYTIIFVFTVLAIAAFAGICYRVDAIKQAMGL